MNTMSNRAAILTALIAPTMLLTVATEAQSLSDRIEGVARKQQAAAAQDSSKSVMLGTLLYTDITVDFNDTPAREAFNYIKTLIGPELVVRYSDDRTGFGIDPDAEITLKASNKPLLTVIEMMLQQCSDLEPCTWQLRKGYIEVGTKERLSVNAARELRMYPIRDLLFEIPYFDNAPQFDLNSAISQGSQGGGGGSGGGGGGGGGGG
ncbi:MAG: hypothetical protein MK085_04750 [Phycisphaerales bacterium]|nr:hypothetical protein [Phycisphaerales bacterium]